MVKRYHPRLCGSSSLSTGLGPGCRSLVVLIGSCRTGSGNGRGLLSFGCGTVPQQFSHVCEEVRKVVPKRVGVGEPSDGDNNNNNRMFIFPDRSQLQYIGVRNNHHGIVATIIRKESDYGNKIKLGTTKNNW